MDTFTPPPSNGAHGHPAAEAVYGGPLGSDAARSGEWRAAALDAALHAAIYYGQGENELLRQARLHAPAQQTLGLWADYRQMMLFLERAGVAAEALLPASHHYAEGHATPSLVAGWYAARWQGHAVEIALAPSFDGKGDVLLIGSDLAALQTLSKAIAEAGERPTGRSLRFSSSWEQAPDLDQELGKVTWDDVVLPPALAAEVQESVNAFFAHRDVYHALGFAWRRGLLLVGPPGTGKTMICKAVAAAHPKLPFLYVRSVQEEARGRGGDAVKTIFQRARKLAPCILAFEDIDGLVGNERRTVFLNELDGFKGNDGLFVIASSNHPGKIDEALLKRPSRFDRVFHIGLPERAERREFCARLLARGTFAARCAPELDQDALADRVARRTEGFTPAYLKEAFIAAALAQAQAGRTLLGAEFADEVERQIGLLSDYMKRAKNPDAWAEMRPAGDTVGFRA